MLPRLERHQEVAGTYEYVFCDSWKHEILLVRIMEPDPNAPYPSCIEGRELSTGGRGWVLGELGELH